MPEDTREPKAKPVPTTAPEGCIDRTMGDQYWTFVHRPGSVSDCKERLRLMEHAIQCPACLEAVTEAARPALDETK